MTTTSTSALAFVLAQTQENIRFLRSSNQISPEDAENILSKLSAAPALRNASYPSESSDFSMPLPAMESLSISNKPAPKPSALSRPPPPIPSSFLFKARAIWGYNENDTEPQDLKFSEGDIIEIIDDKNTDWWKGRLRGREGIFPSSYVERSSVQSQSEKPPLMQNNPSPGSGYTPAYQQPQQLPPNVYYGPPQGGQYQAYGPGPQGPPPPNNQYPLYHTGPQGPPPPPAGPVVITNVEEPKKKPGFLQGGLGNTLAHSAVGGVGFGAGSAIGGGIINSIF